MNAPKSPQLEDINTRLPQVIAWVAAVGGAALATGTAWGRNAALVELTKSQIENDRQAAMQDLSEEFSDQLTGIARDVSEIRDNSLSRGEFQMYLDHNCRLVRESGAGYCVTWSEISR